MSAPAFIIGLVLMLWLPAAPIAGAAETAAQDTENCLSCHGRKGAVKRFADGDSVSTYIDGKALDTSVHKSLACTACHAEFSEGRHPQRAFRSKIQYRTKLSRRCRECHDDEALKSRDVHNALFGKERGGEPVVCTNCHSAHAVSRVASGSVATAEERYCLGCHAVESTMVFANGEKVSTRVHVAELRQSAHRNAGCSDCHFGFSTRSHPGKRFRSEREYRVASVEICKRCHYDKYSETAEGIHHALISVGRLEAPTCIDCHGGHSVTSPGRDRLSVTRRCASCHTEVYLRYGRSVHGNALFDENNRDVPVCTDCHSSHKIMDTASAAFHDYIPDRCGGCHADEARMSRYSLSTDVVKTYLADFHGVTLGLYRSESRRYNRPSAAIAVCTDCHGAHEIPRVSGAETKVVKARLLERCRACHRDATENFPDAWLSHYKPSLAAAPLVFIVGLFYRIMLPLTIVGLLFQVILDIRRYLSKR